MNHKAHNGKKVAGAAFVRVGVQDAAARLQCAAPTQIVGDVQILIQPERVSTVWEVQNG